MVDDPHVSGLHTGLDYHSEVDKPYVVDKLGGASPENKAALLLALEASSSRWCESVRLVLAGVKARDQ